MMLEATHTTGPVTRAIGVMRTAQRQDQDAAIGRMIGGSSPPSTPRPEAFGPDREQLRDVSIAGLISLFQGYEAAADAFTHEANTPRACKPSQRILDTASEVHHYAMEDIVTEIEARSPVNKWESHYRREVLLHWYVDREEWLIVEALSAEALQVAAA